MLLEFRTLSFFQGLAQFLLQPLFELACRLDGKGRDKELADSNTSKNLVDNPLDHDKSLTRAGRSGDQNILARGVDGLNLLCRLFLWLVRSSFLGLLKSNFFCS